MTDRKESSKLSGYFELMRAPNSIMVGFAVIVGIVVTSNDYLRIISYTSLFGFLTGFFISSFSMVSNDLYDLKVDRINQPERPLPSGRVSTSNAKALCILFLTSGLLASLPLGAIDFLIASLFAFIGWYYNYSGKKLGLFGNSLVALSLAIPYIFGSFSIGIYSLNLGYLLAITSFFAGMGREVLKGIADVEGDKVRKVKTMAISQGIESAKKTSAALFVFAVLSSSFPIIFGLLGKALVTYIVLIAIPDAIFLVLAAKVLTLKAESDSLKYKSVALIGMMTGLLAYFISGIIV